MKKYAIILFYGALWGLFEATIGFTNHLFHLHLASLILFPIGLICMLFATKRLNFCICIPLIISIVAAILKLSNFAIPVGGHLAHITNPIIGIISEGCLVSVAVWIYKIENYKITLKGIGLLLIFSILFSFLFMCYQLYFGMREFGYIISPMHLAIKLSQITYHIALFFVCTFLMRRLNLQSINDETGTVLETYLALPTIILVLLSTFLFR